jgi:hypothetical protein
LTHKVNHHKWGRIFLKKSQNLQQARRKKKKKTWQRAGDQVPLPHPNMSRQGKGKAESLILSILAKAIFLLTANWFK